MVTVAIPHSSIVPANFMAGMTVLTLPELPAASLPLRVVMNGQVLNINSYRLDGKQISLPENLTDEYFEVDYYLTQTINLDPAITSAKPELPELLLYTILPSTTDAVAIEQDTIDLLLGMVDYSEYDLLLSNSGDLATDAALRSAIILSVYTNAWVEGQNGWWGDTYSGDRPIADSRLWTLMGKKTTPENVQTAIQYVTHATQWLIDDNHFNQIDVQGEHQRHELDWFAFHLTCHRSGKPPITLNL